MNNIDNPAINSLITVDPGDLLNFTYITPSTYGEASMYGEPSYHNTTHTNPNSVLINKENKNQYFIDNDVNDNVSSESDSDCDTEEEISSIQNDVDYDAPNLTDDGARLINTTINSENNLETFMAIENLDIIHHLIQPSCTSMPKSKNTNTAQFIDQTSDSPTLESQNTNGTLSIESQTSDDPTVIVESENTNGVQSIVTPSTDSNPPNQQLFNIMSEIGISIYFHQFSSNCFFL